MTTKNTIVILSATLVTLARVDAAVYDLKTDWSNTSNPNGPWSYLVNGAVVGSGIRTGDSFGAPGAPTIWGGGFLGWSQSNGSQNSYLDLQTGDVYGHTGSLAIDWTSPAAGVAQVDGGAWMLRDIGRSMQWVISLNGVTIEDSGFLSSGDPFSRATPDEFHFSTPVQPGDVLEFRAETLSGYGDYVGVNFTVVTVPEPSTIWFGLLGMISLGLRRRPNRRIG